LLLVSFTAPVHAYENNKFSASINTNLESASAFSRDLSNYENGSEETEPTCLDGIKSRAIEPWIDDVRELLKALSTLENRVLTLKDALGTESENEILQQCNQTIQVYKLCALRFDNLVLKGLPALREDFLNSAVENGVPIKEAQEELASFENRLNEFMAAIHELNDRLHNPFPTDQDSINEILAYIEAVHDLIGHSVEIKDIWVEIWLPYSQQWIKYYGDIWTTDKFHIGFKLEHTCCFLCWWHLGCDVWAQVEVYGYGWGAYHWEYGKIWDAHGLSGERTYYTDGIPGSDFCYWWGIADDIYAEVNVDWWGCWWCGSGWTMNAKVFGFRNISPDIEEVSFSPTEEKPWGTTFTWKVRVQDKFTYSDYYKAYLYLIRDGQETLAGVSGATPGDAQTYAIINWTPGKCQTGSYSYYIVVKDGYFTSGIWVEYGTSDRYPSSGAYPGPQVRRHYTSISQPVYSGGYITGYLTDTDKNEKLVGMGVKLSCSCGHSATSSTSSDGKYSFYHYLPACSGRHTFTVSFGGDKDYFGSQDSNWVDASSVDGHPPYTTSSLSGTAGNAGWWRSAVSVTLSATDYGYCYTSGVRYIRYRIDYGSWNTYYGSSVSFTVSGDGTHHVDYHAVDWEGNTESTKSVNVNIDATPPTSGANPITPYWHNNIPFEITAVAQDTTSGVSSVGLWYRYSPDSSTWGPWTSFGTDSNVPWGWTFYAPGGEGYYEFYTVAVDVAGNGEEPPTIPDTVAGYDITQPDTNLVPYSPDPTNNNTPMYSGTATDGLSGVIDIEYRVDGGVWQNVDPFIPGLTVNFTFTTSTLADGTHNIETRARDDAGNWETTYASDILTVDTVPPTVTITPLTPDPTNINTPTLSGVATDATTTIASVEYCVDGGAWAAATAVDGVFDEATEDYTFTTTVLADGTHTVEVRATDAAGNIVTPTDYASDTFVVDTVPPTILATTLTTPNGGETWYGGDTQNIMWAAADITDANLGTAPVSLLYSTDGVTWNLIVTGEANDGAYSWIVPAINSATVRVRITTTDLAGNSASDESDAGFTIATPDLALAPGDISASKVGPNLRIKANVHNTGLRAATNVLVRFLTPWTTQDKTIVNIPAGGAISTWTNWAWPGPGSYDVSVAADPNNTIQEADETNNSAAVIITIDATGAISVGACVPNPEFSHVYVTFSEAWVYKAGTWLNIPMIERTVDLVYLHESGMTELLGAGRLEPDGYTKVKLIVDEASAVRSETGELINLSLPSSEFVVDYPFEVRSDGFVNVIVYLDLVESIRQVDGGYEFVPALLKVVEEKHSFEASLEPASLELYAGQVGTYAVTVTNTGTVDDVYSLTLISEIEESWIDFPSTIEVPAGESRTALLKFVVPENLILEEDVTYTFQVLVDLPIQQASIFAFAPSSVVDGSLTVKAKIPATIDIDPDTLNLRSQGRWITTYIELPSGYDLASINVGTITLEGVVLAESHPTEIGDYDGDGIPDLMIKFDRAAVGALLSEGEVQLTVTGKVGRVTFEGSDNIWIINPRSGSQGEGQGPPQTPPGQGGQPPGQGNQGQQGGEGQGSSQNQGNNGNGQGQGNQGNANGGQSDGNQGKGKAKGK